MSENEEDENGFDGLGEGPEGDEPMSFFDHVAELRTRLIRSAIGILAGFALSFFFVREVMIFLRFPLEKAWNDASLPGTPDLQVLEIQGALMTDIRLGIFGGIFVAAPIIFYQLWMFISPGLYKHEKAFVIPFVGTSVFMFALGAGFAYMVVLPFAMQWLLSYPNSGWIAALLLKYELGTSSRVIYQLELANYVKGATRIMLAFGAVFEFPLVVAFLAKAGVVTHRMLLQYWKIAILVIFVVAAFLTPPEPVTQLMMALPMVILFFVSVGVAYVLNPAGRLPPPVVEDYEDLEEDE